VVINTENGHHIFFIAYAGHHEAGGWGKPLCGVAKFKRWRLSGVTAGNSTSGASEGTLTTKPYRIIDTLSLTVNAKIAAGGHIVVEVVSRADGDALLTSKVLSGADGQDLQVHWAKGNERQVLDNAKAGAVFHLRLKLKDAVLYSLRGMR
jgi:hypothetical protein